MTAFDALAIAHHALRQGIAGARRKAHQEWGTLAATYEAAMKIWDAQKVEGAAFAERVAGLEHTLRLAWPKGREQEWKYLCPDCRDNGLVISECQGDATCGRTKRHRPHDFGSPCWCQLGARFRVRQKSAEDFTEAAKTRPTKVGRR